MTQSAKDAAYATSTAEKKSFALLQRPLVKGELTKVGEGTPSAHVSIVIHERTIVS